jgi:hypothetical protein
LHHLSQNNNKKLNKRHKLLKKTTKLDVLIWSKEPYLISRDSRPFIPGKGKYKKAVIPGKVRKGKSRELKPRNRQLLLCAVQSRAETAKGTLERRDGWMPGLCSEQIAHQLQIDASI